MKPNCCPYEGPSYKKEGSPLNEGEGPPSESEEMKSSANFGNLFFFFGKDGLPFLGHKSNREGTMGCS